MTRGRRSRGYLLIVAFSLMFVMVLIALVMANMGRHAQGFVMLTQSETLQYEAAQTEIAQYLGVLCNAPDPSGALTAATSTTFRSTVGPISVSGATLNGFCDNPMVGNAYDARFPAWGKSIAGYSELWPQHAVISVITSLTAQPNITAGRFIAAFGRYSPFALFAGNGSVSAASVVSGTPAGDGTGSPYPNMASVYGRTGVTITGALNGPAYACSGPVSIGSGGISRAGWPAPIPVPDSLTSQLDGFRSNAEVGLDSDLDNLLRDWHQALHEDFTLNEGTALAAEATKCATQSALLATPAGPFGNGSSTEATHESNVTMDYDTPGGKLTVQGTLRIPGNGRHTLTFRDVEVQTLWLQSDVVLNVKGNLSAKNVVLSRNATLIVDGTTTIQEALLFDSNIYDGQNYTLNITATLYGKGDTSIAQRMCDATMNWHAASINGRANPYPSNLDFTCITTTSPPVTTPGQVTNPASADFDVRKLRNDATARKLEDYLGTTDSTDFGGFSSIMLLTDGRLSVRSPRCSGFIIAGQTVHLDVETVAGTVWSIGGNIEAPNTRFWFSPGATLAYPYVGGSIGFMQVGAFLPHQIGWVKQQ